MRFVGLPEEPELEKSSQKYSRSGLFLALAGLIIFSSMYLGCMAEPTKTTEKPAANPVAKPSIKRGMTCIEDIGSPVKSSASDRSRGKRMSDKVSKSEKEWKEQLTPEQYRITREKGTERAFSGEYYNCHDKGTYKCVCCGAELFSSDTKYDSGSGWPSFYQPLKTENVKEEDDNTFGMVRTEVTCNKCGAHLGHVFPDGPKPTNLRYCINSQSLKLEKK